MKKKVLIFGMGGYDNFGDLAMYEFLVSKVSKENSSVKISSIYYRNNKNIFNSIKGIKSRNILVIPHKLALLKIIYIKILAYFMSCIYDSIYFPGGGNLNSYYSTAVYDSYVFVKAFNRKKRYIEFRPQSVGPLTKEKDKKYLIKILEKSNTFYVRDKISYHFVETMHKNKAILVKDDAWDTPSEKPTLDFFEKPISFIGMSFRPFMFENEVILKNIKEIVDFLISKNENILFIPISFSTKDPTYVDNYFLQKYYKNDNVYFLDKYYDISKLTPSNIVYFIKKCKYTIGLSYHFNVFSISNDIESYAIYYDDYYKIKNLGLYQAFGNEQNVIDITSSKELNRLVNTINGKYK